MGSVDPAATTVFIGGSRCISHVPVPAKDRIDRIIETGLAVVIGDASGADKAVLIDVSGCRAVTFQTKDDWDAFLLECDEHLRRGLEKRALPDEWFDRITTQT